ncbi:MAG: tetratricopeptide repeat protein [Candidatus Hodarchaeota archaeon]
MTEFQELYHLQTSLSLIFDRIGITQEIQDNLSLHELSQQEQDQLTLLIEKFEFSFEEMRENPTHLEEGFDQRLFIRLGNYYYCQGDLSKALEYYNISSLVDENEWAYFNSAKILQGQDQLDSAYEKYDQAIKIKPDFSQALCHQAEILIHQGRTEKAIEKLKKSQQLNPNDPETNKLLANYYIEHGENKEALIHLKAIHHRDSDVITKIEELEKRQSLLNRLFRRFRNR